MTTAVPEPREVRWPDYRAVWRWHFYAGLFCIPFVIVLSITGAIYLFKPQIEAWTDRQFDQLTVGRRAPVTEQVRAAMAVIPGAIPTGYEIPAAPQSAARVLVRAGGETIRVFVHPETLQVLHQVPDDERLMRWMFRFHGELLMGDRGSNLVELAASWTIVMLLTGLYLWWPRHAKGWGGVLYPRFFHGSKTLWRDLHSVVGVWITACSLFLLATGLPWAKFWGNYFKEIRRVTGTAVAQQDWTTGSEPRPRAKDSGGGEHAGHNHSGGAGARPGRSGRRASMPKDLNAFDRVVAAVEPLGLEAPVVVAPPASGEEKWTAKSMTQNRPHRVNLVVHGQTGAILEREDFRDRHWVDQVVGYGIAAHEGQLFGWPNQLLGLLTAAGLVLVSCSGVVLWWRRRDQGVLGAPRAILSPRISWGLIGLIVMLAVYIPLFGASLLLVLLLESVVLRRIPWTRRWLGLDS